MGVLLMLMTIGGLLVAGVFLVAAIAAKIEWLRNFILGGVAVWFVFYAVMLLGFSINSTEKTLAIDEPKRFCGFYLDCHLSASVMGVRVTKTLGTQTANGDFYIVRIRVVSDARRSHLSLITVDTHVVDSAGRTYDRDTRAETQLNPQPEFEKEMEPDESMEKDIVFDLPETVLDPRLDIRDGYGIDHAIEAVLVGDEDSILHKRVFFELTETGSPRGKNQ